MDKQELIKNVLSNMEYDESIRSGIWKCKDDTYQELMHVAHGDMLPDDWRYQMIHDSLIVMSETDDEDDVFEMLDNQVPVYTHELMAWMGSSNSRYSYVDEAIEEFGKGDSIINDIMRGYYQELNEVYYLIEGWINEKLDDMEDDQ